MQRKKVELINNSGKKVFEKSCASCHTSGFKGWLTGAPKIGEKEEWKSFFDKGVSVMVTHVYKGTKNMKNTTKFIQKHK